MKTTSILAFALGALSFPAARAGADAARRPITHEDVWLMRRVGIPVPSPDGKWVAYSVVQPAYDPKDQLADLWISPSDASAPPRQVTHAKGAPSGTVWSPDSRRLAFSAKREGDDAPEIYTLDLAQGGEAERVTRLATGARSPEWSPDGASLLFVSDVPPVDAMKTKANIRTYDGFPIRFWDHWLDDKRPHIFVQRLAPDSKARDLFAGTRLAAAAGYSIRQSETGEDVDAAWAPDAKSVVFAATNERDRTAYAEAVFQVFSVPASGGEPSALTAGADSYASPAFSPDGRTLLVKLEKGGDGKIYHHARVASFPWPFNGSARRVLTDGLDLTVGRFAASQDGGTVYFTAETGGHERLYSVPSRGGGVRGLGLPESGCLSGLAIGGPTMVADYDSAASPPEVVRIDPERATLSALTSFNSATLATLDLPPIEGFTFTSAGGRSIQSFLVRPAGFRPGARYPLLVTMHGGPASMWRDAWGIRWNYHLLAAPGYVLVLTNYSGSTGFSEAFGQAIQLDPLRTPGDEINQAADEAIRRYRFIDGSRQAAAGASYGGHLANWMEATTTRYRCIISHAGLVNLESQWGTSDFIYNRELMNGGPVWEQGAVWREQNPIRYAGNHFKGTGWVTPILLSVGEKDARVPMNNTIENWSYLQRLQVPSRLLVFPDENHWISRGEDSRAWYGEVQTWLARWLK
jgi:dipeptidyl aminopeptidase/acylaminoacyl peptidase